LGRDDSPDAFRNLVKWVRGASVWRENVIAANNAYDEQYLKYFTAGADIEHEIRTFGHAHPDANSSPSSSSSLPHFSILPSRYQTLRHVTKSVFLSSSLPPSPSILVDYGHDHPAGSSVEWRSQLGLSRYHEPKLKSSFFFDSSVRT
jgi:hypothetical protein